MVPLKKTLTRSVPNVSLLSRSTKDTWRMSRSDTIREDFDVFPRTAKEWRDWQEVSSSHRFPYVEESLGRNYSWLRNLLESISAMNEFVQTGSCSFNFDEVPTPADYANTDGTTQKRSKMTSVIDVFAIRVSESKDEAHTQRYSKTFLESMQQFGLSLEVSHNCECRSIRCS